MPANEMTYWDNVACNTGAKKNLGRPRTGIIKECTFCKKEFYVKPSHIHRRTMCSKKCAGELLSKTQVGHNNPYYRGEVFTTCEICDTIFRQTPSRIEEGRKRCSNKCRAISMSGEKSKWWVHDRTLIKTSENRMSAVYIKWRKKVHKRDNSICRMSNEKCKGSLEVHHILNWSEYPENRYDTSNGITLCHYHHPRGRKKEKDLIPLFYKLLNIEQRE